jgi:peptidyl-prolyl cis-trans isomerase D
LGWIKQGTTIDTCFIIPQNRVIKIEANFGVQILEVTDRSPEERKVQVAVVEKTAHPRPTTYQNIFAQANNLSSESGNKREQFIAAAAAKKLSVASAPALKEADRTLSSLPNANIRDLARWAYEAKTGDVSSVLTVDNYFVVATLAEVRNQGVIPFEQVKSEIETTLRETQQKERLAQELKDAIANATAIETIAEQINLPLQTASDISFTGSSFISGIGLEPKLQGAVVGAPENTLTGPVKGALGVYMFTVTRRHVGAAYTLEEEKTRERYMRQYDMTTMQQQYNELYDGLEKWANVQDWRGRFF